MAPGGVGAAGAAAAEVIVGMLSVTIQDSGQGIPQENLGKIFDPFFSTKERGTGLGLALVQQIVVEHGGRVDVASGAGEGTTFSLTFPALAASPSAATEAREEDESAPAGAALAHGAEGVTAAR